jgi:PAS domain-containing protein
VDQLSTDFSSNAPAAHDDPAAPSLAQAALQQAEEQLRLIFENIRDYAVFTVSLENHITTWNTGAERIFGYSAAEVLGQSTDLKARLRLDVAVSAIITGTVFS